MPGESLSLDFIIRLCENGIKTKADYHVKLAEKSLTPTPEDYKTLWGERAPQKIQEPEDEQIYLLTREGQLSKLSWNH